MTIRIDPRVPIVWRTPHEVQLGVDVPVCVLPATTATERILAALVAGVPPGALEVVAEHTGADRDVLEKVMAAVAPVLLPADAAPSSRAKPVVVIDGATADDLRALLAALGMRTSGGAARPDAVVLTASFVVSPARFLTWLGRDVPHLPIVFGDRIVEIGPLVEPGAGPCLRCLSLHRRDADAAWPAIAAQLDGADAATLLPLPRAVAAVHAARMLEDLLSRDDHLWADRSIRIDAASGELSERVHLPHPECGCRALPGNVTALRRRSAARADAPSSGTASSWPG